MNTMWKTCQITLNQLNPTAYGQLRNLAAVETMLFSGAGIPATWRCQRWKGVVSSAASASGWGNLFELCMIKTWSQLQLFSHVRPMAQAQLKSRYTTIRGWDIMSSLNSQPNANLLLVPTMGITWNHTESRWTSPGNSEVYPPTTKAWRHPSSSKRSSKAILNFQSNKDCNHLALWPSRHNHKFEIV